MKCDVCNGEMATGIAINSAKEDDHWFGMHVSANADTINFIQVQKCVECGRSLNDREVEKRMYPDSALKSPKGEFKNSLVEMVKANFEKIKK